MSNTFFGFFCHFSVMDRVRTGNCRKKPIPKASQTGGEKERKFSKKSGSEKLSEPLPQREIPTPTTSKSSPLKKWLGKTFRTTLTKENLNPLGKQSQPSEKVARKNFPNHSSRRKSSHNQQANPAHQKSGPEKLSEPLFSGGEGFLEKPGLGLTFRRFPVFFLKRTAVARGL